MMVSRSQSRQSVLGVLAHEALSEEILVRQFDVEDRQKLLKIRKLEL